MVMPSKGVPFPIDEWPSVVINGLTILNRNNWFPVTDGHITSSSVGALAVSESHPDTVYIGMGESCIRGNIMPGDGVYKSTDRGFHWSPANNGLTSLEVKKLAYDEVNDVLLVGTNPRLEAPLPQPARKYSNGPQ